MQRPRWQFCFFLASLVFAWQIAVCAVSPAEEPGEAAVPLEGAPIHNLFRLTPRLYSGSGPESDADFEYLKSLGIKTIVSVDGAAPDVPAARERGLRYVHIPLQYRGVPQDAGRALAKAMKECEGPVFVHCHHGRHRGPAAAAVCAIASGSWTSDQAVRFLKAAGTGQQYPGLWKDVADFRPLTEEQDRRLPAVVLAETSPISSLAEAMVRIDGLTDDVQQRLQKLPQNASTGLPTEDAVQLHEEFLEAARLLMGNEPLRAGLRASAEEARKLTDALNAAAALQVLTRLQAQCRDCHAAFRDH